MKRRKKRIIPKKKERAVLSDVLPYELPATFSNRHFYQFLIKNNVQLVENTITWDPNGEELKELIKILFDLRDPKLIKEEFDGKIELDKDYSAINRCFRTIPFNFKIAHHSNRFRQLSLIHPKSQLSLVAFYDKYKELLTYYCSLSNFSLRKPYKQAKFTYYKDKSHFKNLAYDHEFKSAEEFDKEYQNLKTFFTYKSISNVYKFYESPIYHKCEKKYDNLLRFDISKCFDSIYTHSITWSTLNKIIVKDNIPESSKTFGGIFDRVMQSLNYSETNGIVIGPEFSRIFAEIILQNIDQKTEKKLRESKYQLRNKVDYEAFRYVDDYFVFYNNESIKDKIFDEFSLQLQEFNLFINNSKTKDQKKPLITSITKAKLGVSDLLNSSLEYKTKEELTDDNSSNEKKYSIYISSNKLITRYKSIISDTGIEYQDIQNYTLACIDRKVVKLIDVYSNKIDNKERKEKQLLKALFEIINFSFFVYSVFPKVNSTIKLCLLLTKIIKFSKGQKLFNTDNKHLVLKKISDEIFLVLRKYKSSDHTQIETLYLLITLKQLGKEYFISETLLAKHYGIDIEKKKCSNKLNYFSIVVILFYIGNKKKYEQSKKILTNYILDYFENINHLNRDKSTEMTLLFFDILSCPYLDRKFKNKILTLYDIPSSRGHLRSKMIGFQKAWFTKWENFDFGKELEAKKSQEVY